MAQPIENALAAFATVISAVSGIQTATSLPKEKMAQNPFCVVYASRGFIDLGPIGTRKSLSNFVCDVLKKRVDLPNDLSVIVPMIDTITAAILAELSPGGGKFSNTIQTFKRVTYEFLPFVDYADVQMIGYRYICEEVKILV